METKQPKFTINCPYCGKGFELADAVLQPLRTELQQSLETKYEAKYKDEIQIEKQKLTSQIEKNAKDSVEGTITELKEQIDDTTKKLSEAKVSEKELRKANRELKAKQDDIEIEIEKKVEKASDSIREQMENKYELKLSDKEKKLADMKKQIEDLQKRAELGSQEAQGEVLELKLEDILRTQFLGDNIQPVAKGVKGADVIQKVNNKLGQCCGTIIWESKRTQSWNNSWIGKLRENQAEEKAEIAVIVSAVLPANVDKFGLIEDVWVTHWSFISQLCCSLRVNLIELHKSKLATQGMGDKMGLLYNYLCSTQFKQRVESMATAFSAMHEGLEQEKSAMQRIWSKREKQIDVVMNSTVGMYGDIEGIIGVALPQIELLQLPYQQIDKAISE